MAGGVREWCEDWYNEKHNLKNSRGGSWAYPEVRVFRIASIDWNAPTHVTTSTGFRLVRVPEPR